MESHDSPRHEVTRKVEVERIVLSRWAVLIYTGFKIKMDPLIFS